MMTHRHITIGILGFVLFWGLTGLLCPGTTQAQDIHNFSIPDDNDMFSREVRKALQAQTAFPNLPLLDCSVEYLRRSERKDVVYRRGPVDLYQQGATTGRITVPAIGGKPASGVDAPAFTGGILVDLPRIGESRTAGEFAADRYRYLLRIALVPESYEGQLLHARLFLERALVTVDGERIDIQQNEVYSRDITLEGNVPLKFDLPRWDSASEQASLIPEGLQESVLLTLELPRYFALSQNEPDPFSSSTRIRYAVPTESDIRLTISIAGEEVMLDEGRKQAGKYEVQWDAPPLADASYTATLTAAEPDGSELYAGHVQMTHDSDAPDLQSLTPEPATAFIPSGLAISLESGVAYQMPGDDMHPMRNMFTHLAFRIGYRFSQTFEAGLVAGQEAFNERPGDNVDIARITDYGGVVAYTYGYIGAYARYSPGRSRIQPLMQVSAGFTDAAALTEVSAGIRAAIHPHLAMYLAPSFMVHFHNTTSSKLGIHYGAEVRF